MLAVIKEKQVTEKQAEQLELEEMIPEKFDPEITFLANKQAADIPKQKGVYGTLTREQTAMLLAASKAPTVTPKDDTPKKEYPILPRETAERLVREHYEYLEEQKKKRMEKDEWATLKTIESDIKTDIKTKPSTSTKA